MLQEHVAAKCSEDKIASSTHWRDILQGCVARKCSRDEIAELAHLWKVARTCLRDTLQRHILSCALALFHPRNMKFVKNLPLQHVPWSSTSWTPCDMLEGQILHKFPVARVKKCQRTREDVSLQHFPETRPGNFFTSMQTLQFGPCCMSLLHSLATCPFRQCALNAILSSLHFAATCSCNMSPRVGPPLESQHCGVNKFISECFLYLGISKDKKCIKELVW